MNLRWLIVVLLWLIITACGNTSTPIPQATSTPQITLPPTVVPSPIATRTTTSVLPTATSSATSTPLPVTPTAQSTTRQWNFDGDAVGALPPGMVIYSGAWAVRAEADAPSPPNALCQTGQATYPALALSNAKYSDVVMTARFKPISGQTDRAGGLIFRVQDKDNYYILRANALEDNVNFYIYANGQRSTIKEGQAKVASGQWHELRVEVVGNRMRGFLNGQLVVETSDDTYKAGGVGLWTKADSVTCFDEINIMAPPTASVTQPAASTTTNPPSQLRMESIQLMTIINPDDLEPIIEAIYNLTGVQNVQASPQELQVTYDPDQVSHKQIVDIIEGHGVHVKQ